MNNLYHNLIFIFLFSFTLGEIYHNISLGRVKGTTMWSRNNRKFYAFLSLPYAKPPVGKLRFQNPVLYTEPWSNIYDATKQPNLCPQMQSKGYRGTEDCLYLNLYTPQSTSHITRKLPVWYFIYPGRRLFGDPITEHYGPHYIMDHDVIFIIASYRIGPLGFLSTEDNVIKGNMGLKDQTMVLRWINTYIAEFGGDPNNVAISGESSGAVDVWLHTFSPLSANLFHKSISESGSALNYRTIPEPGAAKQQAWRLARIVGCGHYYIKSSEDLLECLKMIPAEVLVQSTFTMMHDYIFPHTFYGLVIEPKDSEGAFLVSYPVLDLAKPNNKTVMMGIVPEEGQQKMIAMYSYPSKDKKVKERARQHFFSNYERLFPLMYSFDYSPERGQIMNTVFQKYCPNQTIENTFYGAAKAAGIATVTVGLIESALKYPGTTYFYLYDHLNQVAYKKVYETVFQLYSNYKLGVIHGEEFRSLFTMDGGFPRVEGDDRIMSELVVKLFCNFVTYSNPNGLDKNQIWKPVNSPNIEYAHLTNLSVIPKIKPEWKHYLFWKNMGNPSLMTLERLNAQLNGKYLLPQHQLLKKELQRQL